MRGPIPEDLAALLARAHGETEVVEMHGRKVPCIVVPGPKYEEMVAATAGQPLTVRTDLNILGDGMGHVFVEVVLMFSRGGLVEKFLINANTCLEFFERLEESQMIAVSAGGGGSVFAVQLPRPEPVEDALWKIKTGLEKGQYRWHFGERRDGLGSS